VHDALLVGGGRRGNPLLIVLLETGYPLDGGCCRVELLIRNVRRLVSGTRRRGVGLSVHCGGAEKVRTNQQDRSGGRQHQDSHHCLLCKASRNAGSNVKYVVGPSSR